MIANFILKSLLVLFVFCSVQSFAEISQHHLARAANISNVSHEDRLHLLRLILRGPQLTATPTQIPGTSLIVQGPSHGAGVFLRIETSSTGPLILIGRSLSKNLNGNQIDYNRETVGTLLLSLLYPIEQIAESNRLESRAYELLHFWNEDQAHQVLADFREMLQDRNSQNLAELYFRGWVPTILDELYSSYLATNSRIALQLIYEFQWVVGRHFDRSLSRDPDILWIDGAIESQLRIALADDRNSFTTRRLTLALAWLSTVTSLRVNAIAQIPGGESLTKSVDSREILRRAHSIRNLVQILGLTILKFRSALEAQNLASNVMENKLLFNATDLDELLSTIFALSTTMEDPNIVNYNQLTDEDLVEDLSLRVLMRLAELQKAIMQSENFKRIVGIANVDPVEMGMPEAIQGVYRRYRDNPACENLWELN